MGAHTATLTHCDTHTCQHAHVIDMAGSACFLLSHGHADRQRTMPVTNTWGRPQHVPGRVHRGTCAASCAPGHANTLVNMQTLGHMFHGIHPHTCHQALVPPEGSHTPDSYTHAHIRLLETHRCQALGYMLIKTTYGHPALTHTQAPSCPSLPTVTYAGKLTSMLTLARTVASGTRQVFQIHRGGLSWGSHRRAGGGGDPARDPEFQPRLRAHALLGQPPSRPIPIGGG